MGDGRTMVQTTLAVGDAHYLLAQGHELDDLKRRIEEAVRSGGGFVDFIVVGNRTVSVFMNGSERLVLTVQTVVFDERDTGDPGAPYGGMYDIDSSAVRSGAVDPL